MLVFLRERKPKSLKSHGDTRERRNAFHISKLVNSRFDLLRGAIIGAARSKTSRGHKIAGSQGNREENRG